MNAKVLAICVGGLGLLTIGITDESILPSPSMELWYQHSGYNTTDAAVQKSKELIDKAAAAGYTGALFWDSSFNMMGNPDWNPDNEDRLKDVMNYAHKRHLKAIAEAAPFGWSNDVLAVNPNWAEAQRVVGTRFEVAPDGRSLKLVNSLPALVNGNFASGQTGWFDMGDSHVAVVANARGGTAAVTMVDPPGNARIRQKIKVHPWRQYHLSFFYKAVGAQVGSPMVIVYDGSNLDKMRFIVNLHETADWMNPHYLFNSGDSTELAIYMGVWGGAKGTIEFNDVQLEETGLVWLAHREGAPFKLYDPENPSKVYTPGVDYDKVIDPDMLPNRPCFHNIFHWPPPFTLPASTQLKPGQIVAADYYAVTPLTNGNQVGMCMTEPGVYKWLSKNAHELRQVMRRGSDVLLYYDEIRHANSCFSCRAKNMTAGELLAWNFGKTYDIYHEALPHSSFWVWSDMFDPYHNAHGNVMYVEGNLAGSWKGLPPEVSILNWNHDKLKESLTWFSGLNPQQPIPHQQIVAGYYGAADAAGAARSDLAAAMGIPGIRGLMYTTWDQEYAKLQVYADAARAAWPDYVKSVPKK
jgi:hypothetical protein